MEIFSFDVISAISWLMQYPKVFRHTFLFTDASRDDLYNLIHSPILHVRELSLANRSRLIRVFSQRYSYHMCCFMIRFISFISVSCYVLHPLYLLSFIQWH